MGGIFKAYDVRGVVPEELDERSAYAIGYFFPQILEPEDLATVQAVVVSRDMRATSPALADAFQQGVRTAGMEVWDIGLATTPMNYFAVGFLGASAGAQVTASHNPAQYNGFKFSRRHAIPVSSETGIGKLELLVRRGQPASPSPRGAYQTREVWPAYETHVLGFLRLSAPRLKVAVDVANGMATLYEPIFQKLNLDLVPLFFGLDGSFPNHEANPLKEENLRFLKQAVVEQGCHFGVAFDGDADRAIMVDEQGVVVGADLVTALLAGPILERFPGAKIVYDVRSSWATREAILAAGGVPVRERVGHSFMKATMRQLGSPFGGELAGHFYYRDNFYADSAIITMIEVLNVLRREQQPLSALVAPFRRYARTGEVNFHVANKDEVIAALAQTFASGKVDFLDGITVEFDDWWFNVRPSNTEPLLRLVMEARDPKKLAEAQEEVVEVIRRVGRDS
ncbi:MAG: phosphomannomutase/phosphoglucomutase [Thermoanaerobaculum sp.]|nr:phosphomannomutase/phosphoglucomutase [Thermoanaerobaculum sp.]